MIKSSTQKYLGRNPWVGFMIAGWWLMSCSQKDQAVVMFSSDILEVHAMSQQVYRHLAYLQTTGMSLNNNFGSDTTVLVGNEEVQVNYFGPGHSVDNIVGYVPSEGALFGGCLIKARGAGKGYTGDANLVE